MVFGSTLLEVGIGVIFVYLLLSLLCSAFSELIESFMKFRARYLEKGIGKLLNDPALVSDFLNHPLVKPLGERPSYIPARTFSLVLWNMATTEAVKGKNAAAGVTQDLKAIRSLIASVNVEKYAHIQTSLLVLIDEAGNDINKARSNIEGWYNDAMDRVSGWYKRRTHLILVVIGFLAAAVLNVDTINVTRALWYNDALRTSVVAAAENYVKTNPAPTSTPQASLAPAAVPSPTATPSATPSAETQAEEQAKIALAKINNIREEINKLNLPVGWLFEPKKEDQKYIDENTKQFNQTLYNNDLKAYRTDPRRLPSDGYGWFLKVLGIFFTALAVSQGAPFWFDLLNRFIVIRSTVKPHEKSPEQPSKDKPTSESSAQEAGNEDQEGDGKN